MEQSFRNEHLDIWIENGILYVTHHAEILTLSIVMEGVKQRLILMNGKKLPMLSDIRKIKFAEKEVRTYLAQPIGSEGLTAGAMIVRSVFQETIGNLFIHFNKPLVPAKLFTDKKEAIKWLKRFEAP